MIKSKDFLILGLSIFILQSSVFAQSFEQKIYRYYISGDINSWQKELEVPNPESLGQEDLYNLALAHYGFIGYCLGRDEKQRARPYLDRVEGYAEILLSRNPDEPKYVALRGALFGFRLIYQPQKMMTIGPKSLKYINRAMELDPECPQALVENANTDWFMPAMFGGSRDKAVEGYKKAISNLEKDPASLKDSWYYLNLHIALAGWYEERNMTFMAREMYRKAIQVDPAFSWAREKLK